MKHFAHTRRWLAALAMSCALASSAAPNTTELQKKARARMKSLDFEAALPLLERLRDLPGTDAFRTSVLVDLAVTWVNLGRFDDARKTFDEALSVTSTLELPPSTAPKVRRVFDEAREAREPRPVVPPPAPAPPPPPLEQSPPQKPPEVSKPVRGPRLVTVPLALAGAGVGALTFGLVAAAQSQQATRELASALHLTPQVEALLARRQTWAVLSWVGYGLSAAGLLAGAAVYFFSGGNDLSATALVTPDTAAIAVSGHF